MRKLPYIRDKKLYAAVMGACSWIRDSGYFNKATSYYADKYDVDVDEVRKYVRIAQGNGQKIANKKRKTTFKWYVACYVRDYNPDGEHDCGENATWNYTEKDYYDNTKACIVRAKNKNNARKNVSDEPEDRWAGYWYNRILMIKEFGTKKEAEDYKKSQEFLEDCKTAIQEQHPRH